MSTCRAGATYPRGLVRVGALLVLHRAGRAALAAWRRMATGRLPDRRRRDFLGDRSGAQEDRDDSERGDEEQRSELASSCVHANSFD
jgi:hypothetical protein